MKKLILVAILSLALVVGITFSSYAGEVSPLDPMPTSAPTETECQINDNCPEPTAQPTTEPLPDPTATLNPYPDPEDDDDDNDPKPTKTLQPYPEPEHEEPATLGRKSLTETILDIEIVKVILNLIY